MKLKLRLTVLVSAAVAIALAFGFLAAPAQTARAADASTLNVAFSQEPDSLNGYYSQMAFAQWAIFLLQANLWDYDDKLGAVPVLAKEVPSGANGGISKDGKTLTIKLKDGLKWSDGQPLDAHDVAFTMQMCMDKANNFLQCATQLDQVTSVKEVDKTTVSVTTKDPQYPENIFGVIGYFYPLPAHIYEPIYKGAKTSPATAAATPEGTAAAAPPGLLEQADENQNPTAFSGAYTLKEWKRGESLTFSANPNYVLGKPKISTVVIKIFPDAQSSYAAFASGQVDFIPNLQPADTKTISGLVKDPKSVTFFSIYGSYMEALWFNLFKDGTGPKAGNAALQDPIVRHAIELGIDRKGMTKDLLFDLVPPAETFFSGSPFEDKAVKLVDYNPDKANKMLDDAGYKLGSDGVRAKGNVRLELTYATTKNATRQKNQAYIQQNLQKIGVKVNLVSYDATTFFNPYTAGGIVTTGQADINEFANNGATTNPVLGRQFACDQVISDKNPGGQNQVGYCNPDFDKLELKSEDATDAKGGLDAAHQMQTIFVKDLPIIPLYARADIYAYQTDRFVKTPKVGAGVTNQWFDIVNWELK
jgi:peptide/nickel transport system substrate-binding protein